MADLVHVPSLRRIAEQLKESRFPGRTCTRRWTRSTSLSSFSLGQDARRMHVFRDRSLLADAHLPRKFTENEIGIGFSGLEVLIVSLEISCPTKIRGRQRFADTNVVPMFRCIQ